MSNSEVAMHSDRKGFASPGREMTGPISTFMSRLALRPWTRQGYDPTTLYNDSFAFDFVATNGKSSREVPGPYVSSVSVTEH